MTCNRALVSCKSLLHYYETMGKRDHISRYMRCGVFLFVYTLAVVLVLKTLHRGSAIECHEAEEQSIIEELSNNQAHEYNTTVDLRLILITFNRPKSVLKTLTALNRLLTDRAVVALEVWIDVDKDGVAEREIVDIANNFQFSLGSKTVHIRSKNGGTIAQWFYTWRPKPNTKELALIFEDDITISPYAWRWLKLVHAKYNNWSRVAGYSLECEHLKIFVNDQRSLGAEDLMYAYRIHGNYGWAPNPRVWRRFQDWLTSVRSDRTFKPYVDGIKPTTWYKSFERDNKAHGMFEMWLICFTHFNNLLTIYSNFKGHRQLSSNSSVSGHCLSVHRAEPGMNFPGPGLSDDETRSLLLTSWSRSFEVMPTAIKMIDYHGDKI